MACLEIHNWKIVCSDAYRVTDGGASKLTWPGRGESPEELASTIELIGGYFLLSYMVGFEPPAQHQCSPCCAGALPTSTGPASTSQHPQQAVTQAAAQAILTLTSTYGILEFWDSYVLLKGTFSWDSGKRCSTKISDFCVILYFALVNGSSRRKLQKNYVHVRC